MKRKMKKFRKFIKPAGNESGMTLVVVMLLSLVALIITSALIYMVQSGTEISGMQKRYATALDAGMGGVGVAKEFIDTRGVPGGMPGFANVNFQLTTEGLVCSTVKLINATASWPANCSSSFTLNPSDNPNSGNASYDMTANLGNYTVYAKIVGTVPGNTAAVSGLCKTGVVASDSGQVSVPAVPYLYTLEILSQGKNAQGATLPERSKLSAVYQY